MFPEAAKGDNGVYSLINEDFLFKFADDKAPNTQLIQGVTLNVTSLEDTMKFYQKVGMTKSTDNSLECQSYESVFKLHLNQVETIERAKAFGRIAFSCEDEDVQNVHDNGGAKVVNAPVTLPTEGKADVVVTILQSPDDQELCFVNDKGFRDLSQETKEEVDWTRYDKLTKTMDKYAYLAK